MPAAFKKYFPRTWSIIDCSEFFIQRPRKVTQQYKTYSSYKSHNTFKALLSINPYGAFNFVSDLWSGNTSDIFITKHCGFLDNIKPGMDVMADRGFDIMDVLLKRNATLSCPAFTRKCGYGKGKRLNVSEILRTRQIARFRIHVERAIQRLKCYRMASNTMPLSYKPIASQIIKVAAAFANLGLPLIGKN